MPGYYMSPAVKAYNKRNPRAHIYATDTILGDPIFKVCGFGVGERMVRSKKFRAECVAALAAVVEKHGLKAVKMEA